MKRLLISVTIGAALTFELILLGGPALSQSLRDARHGELLYETHCITCHSGQVHWRERRLATDWASLVLQVERWQNNNGLGWTNQDVADVAQYLNNRYYRYPQRD